MTDAPSAVLLLRLQSVGSNTNLWGGYINTALQTLERASKGYQALAVTGDATISWSNYSAANDGSVAFLKLTGSISSPATLTFPGYQHYLSGHNTTGAAVTIKCSGGTGVTIANGDRFLLYCDATDYYNAAPTVFATGITVAGKVSGMTAGLAGTDGVNVAQLAAAIAAAVIPGTAGTLLNSITDTTRGFLTDKLIVTGTGAAVVTATTENPAGNEKQSYEVSVGELGLVDAGLQSASFSASAGNAYTAPTGGTITLAAPTGSRRKMAVSLYGAGVTIFSGVISSGGAILSSLTMAGDQTIILTDADATRGWV